MYKVFKTFEVGICEDKPVKTADGEDAFIKGGIKIPVAEIHKSSVTPTEIRKSIREAGYSLHKGQEGYADELVDRREKRYMSDETYYQNSILVEA